MSFLSRLFGNREDALAPVRPLWHRVVEIAREKAWYAEYDVADTVPGRFDAITLVLALVLLRMEQDEALIEPSVRLTELFIDDMDGQLRQTGLGDLVVGKHVGKLMGTLGGRLGVLREALPQDDPALAEVIARNVTLVEGGEAAKLVPAVRKLAGTLNALSADDLMAARIER
ncbi:ubiquinol-cytochrome C chaperone family protein [Novosphingobium sp. G106]|uniref:ubiquinol-cytochrome C chaperone family protein n=1 Tax=Novosphingobium sp. G106 TaxID=2849500 RepID=UPI001C2CD600|nr:ubiquinol-cytochrome C chaperone family protein [Novosphingobium sp. G106]MBV1691518.1 ubiquinol-cytochrome C chaperone family protein [Novosphingobium sp. G106]